MLLLFRSILTLSHSTFFFFTATAPTEIYTLSLHDALPIYRAAGAGRRGRRHRHAPAGECRRTVQRRSEEHMSELQSRFDLVCRLLLEKKKKKKKKKRKNPFHND